MSCNPTISIVIPVYNGAKYIAATLDSVLAQTLPTWECIVVDDGSTDGTAAMVEGYLSDVRIQYFRQSNAGVSAARNAGYERASVSTQFVTFLDADDVWETDALEVVSSALSQTPEAPAAYGISGSIDAQGKSIKEGHYEHWSRNRSCIVDNRRLIAPVDQPTTFAMLAFSNCIVTPGAVLIRRQALSEAGGFDPNVSPVEDHDMWLRLSVFGHLILVDRRVIWYRQHGANSSAHRGKMVAARRRLWAKTAASRDITPEQRAVVLQAYKAFYLFQAEWKRTVALDLLRSRKPADSVKMLLSSAVNVAMALSGCPKMRARA